MSYPVHITNIYELLGEEGEQPRVLPKAAAPVKAVATGVKTGGGNISGVKPVQSQPTRSSRGGERGRGRGGPRPARPIPTGEEDSTRTERREGGWSRQEGSENRGERRGRGAPADGFVGNRRVYDRKSGTGRGKEQKKGGSGRGNWGREGEAAEANPEETEGAETKEVVPAEISAEQAERNAEREQREREEREEQEKEDKLLTLDTYLAQKASSAPKLALPEARKANDGADTKDSKKWAAYEVLKKNEDEEKSAEALLEKKKKEKNTVPLNEVFNVRQARPPRQDREDRDDRGDRERGDRPFRGGRGGRRGGEGQPRGSGSSGRGRGGRGGASAPNFEDKSSFPSLAPKA